MTHGLVMNYKLYKKLEVFVSRPFKKVRFGVLTFVIGCLASQTRQQLGNDPVPHGRLH
jgi:hypothetical protein